MVDNYNLFMPTVPTFLSQKFAKTLFITKVKVKRKATRKPVFELRNKEKVNTRETNRRQYATGLPYISKLSEQLTRILKQIDQRLSFLPVHPQHKTDKAAKCGVTQHPMPGLQPTLQGNQQDLWAVGTQRTSVKSPTVSSQRTQVEHRPPVFN